MADVLIRDVPEDVLDRLDAHAAEEGLTRQAFLSRHLDSLAERAAAVTAADLDRFASNFGDLADEEVMRDAWR